MRSRPYQIRGYQNKQRINQLEKFDSEIAWGEPFKLKLWKDSVFAFQEESTFAMLPPAEPAAPVRDRHYTLTRLALTARSGQGFHPIRTELRFVTTPGPRHQPPSSKPGVKRSCLCNSIYDSAKVPTSFRVPLQSRDGWLDPQPWRDDQPCVWASALPLTSVWPFQPLKYRLKKKKLGNQLFR